MTARADPRPLIDAALEEAQRWGLNGSTTVRAVGALSFLVGVNIIVLLTGRADWSVYLWPLAGYAAAATVFFAVRRRRFAGELVSVAAVADVAIVARMQLQSLPLSPFPAGVAGFSLGLFALLVVLNAAPLKPTTVFITALAGTAAEVLLMQRAGVGAGAMVLGGGVLALVATGTQLLARRLHGTVTQLATAALEHAAERERSQHEAALRREAEALAAVEHQRAASLEELQREKDKLAQMLVHDLRSPLMVIMSNVNFARSTLTPAADADLASALNDAAQTSTQLSAMISDLLQIARLEDGTVRLDRQRLDGAAVLRGVVPTAEALGRDTELRVLVDAPAGVALDADAQLLRRILENLVSNAARYTPRRGRLRLAVAMESGAAVFRVQNEGRHLPQELRARLFQKYSQGRTERGGWGIGLYFCRLVADAHGGSIAVEDMPEWPVSFAVRLPAAA